MKQAGIAYATDQIIDLLANGVKAHSCIFHEQAGGGSRNSGKSV